MIKIHFQVETPLYCGGFNAKKAELRVPSIKGMLRYWYRAIQPDLTEEKEIFGSVDGQSLFRLHIDAKQFKSNYDSRGIPRYFNFFLKDKGYISPGERFTLNLQILPKKQHMIRDIFVSLWLMTTIGGLGSRCRRGFGTLSAQHVEDQHSETAFLFEKVNSIEKWMDHVLEGLQQCWQWYRTDKQTQITHPMVHPMLRMYVRKSSCKKWEDALNIGAEVLEEFRKMYCKKNKKVLQVIGTTDNGRYPSAAWLRIVRIGGYYYPVYFVLPSDFSEGAYKDFVELWGGFLKEKGFEESETK